MAYLIVERTFEQPVSDEDLKAVGERLASCLDMYHVRWLRSYVAADRQRMICEYDAPDAESVRMANRSAGASFDRVWNAELFQPQGS